MIKVRELFKHNVNGKTHVVTAISDIFSLNGQWIAERVIMYVEWKPLYYVDHQHTSTYAMLESEFKTKFERTTLPAHSLRNN